MDRATTDLNPAQRLIIESLHRWSVNQAADDVPLSEQVPIVKGFAQVYSDLGSEVPPSP